MVLDRVILRGRTPLPSSGIFLSTGSYTHALGAFTVVRDHRQRWTGVVVALSAGRAVVDALPRCASAQRAGRNWSKNERGQVIEEVVDRVGGVVEAGISGRIRHTSPGQREQFPKNFAERGFRGGQQQSAVSWSTTSAARPMRLSDIGHDARDGLSSTAQRHMPSV